MGKIIARVRERNKAAAAFRLAGMRSEFQRRELRSMVDMQNELDGRFMRIDDEPEPDKWWTWERMMAVWKS